MGVPRVLELLRKLDCDNVFSHKVNKLPVIDGTFLLHRKERIYAVVEKKGGISNIIAEGDIGTIDEYLSGLCRRKGLLNSGAYKSPINNIMIEEEGNE